MFVIELHIDDVDVLEFIKDKLGIGNVRLTKNKCVFAVTDRNGISKLISIFDKYNLNSTKYLDYLNFKIRVFTYYLK